MKVLEVKNINKIYSAYRGAKEVRALDGISFDVEKGEFLGIMGPSGSGKTTLLNLLAGVDRVTSGKIIIKENDISKMKKDKLSLFRRKHIGYIFQDFNLLDSLNLKENIGLPLILDKVNPDKINERVEELMDFFNIKDLKDKYPYNISGGQKQRVAAARALIANPDIIFADEPTGNLDSKSSKDVMETIFDMNKRLESTVLMVSHDPFAASFCSRIIFIIDGQINIEINSDGDRKKFFDKILEIQSVIGGER